MLLSLEEYIKKRKTKDRVNDFNLDKRDSNVQACINYVIDYYFKYLNQDQTKVRDSKHQKSLEKLKSIFKRKFDDQIIENGLLQIFDNYGKRIDIQLQHFVDDLEDFSLLYSDNDFKNLVNRFCDENNLKMPFLKEHKDFLFLLIKKLYDMDNEYDSFEGYQTSPNVYVWLKDTFQNYSVNITNFIHDYLLHMDYDTRQKYIDNYPEMERVPFDFEYIYEKYKSRPFLNKNKSEFKELFLIDWKNWIERDPEIKASVARIFEKRKQAER